MADELDAQDVTGKTTRELEATESGKVKRWLAELSIADEVEKEWRDEAGKYYDLYESKDTKSASFNIMWSNTETLLGATYNSTPVPDVRRRFRDEDPVGKYGALITERALAYEVDEYPFDSVMMSVDLDCLITGRGVARIKYNPVITNDPAAEGDPQTDDNARIAGEMVECEHVQWDDFRRGPGKTWREVPWIAFRHEFTYDMAVEKFGQEIAEELTYETTKASDSVEDEHTKKVFKVAKVWEIWDKEEKRVLFISPSLNTRVCFETPDPLNLKNFYPLPKPIYAVENSRDLTPIPPYRLYKEQAKELDSVSMRINKIVNAMKVRGAYAGNLPEIVKMLEQAQDNELVAVENYTLIAQMGGLDKAIWLMPIDQLAQTLQQLYMARDQIKQTIYEIMGIGDIMRGMTNPNETKGAQVLKSQWGSMRLQRLQREIQRFARDVFEIKAEIICERFTLETLKTITNVQLPMMADKQMAQAQAQQMAQQAQMTGQPPQIPPEIQETLKTPSWEEVYELLQQDALRSYRIDIETDSTVAETIQRDTEGIVEVMTALGNLYTAAAPAIQSGMVPVDVVKELSLVATRRLRMGRAIEDAIDKIQQPPPQQDPQEMEQLKTLKGELQDEAKKLEHAKREYSLQQQEVTHNEQRAAFEQEQAIGMQEKEMDREQLAQFAQQLAQMSQETQQVTTQALQQVAQVLQGIQQQQAEQSMAIQAMFELASKPKRISFERGADGRISGASAEVH